MEAQKELAHLLLLNPMLGGSNLKDLLSLLRHIPTDSPRGFLTYLARSGPAKVFGWTPFLRRVIGPGRRCRPDGRRYRVAKIKR